MMVMRKDVEQVVEMAWLTAVMMAMKRDDEQVVETE